MPVSLSGVSVGFPALSPSSGQVAYVFLTRPPLLANPKISLPFDLHVLGTPPAFILSQDQTLRSNCFIQKDVKFIVFYLNRVIVKHIIKMLLARCLPLFYC